MTDIREELAEVYGEHLLFVDGHDDAIMGIAVRCGTEPVVLYDSDLVIRGLIRTSEMTEDEAREFYEFNIVGAYVGEYTPVFLERPLSLE